MRGRISPADPVPLEIHVPAMPCRGGTELLLSLFAPLGWTVTATPIPLDPAVPGWADSPYVDLRLSGTLTVADALTQLYVLIPVLDDSKHYWVGTDEIDKLLRAGGAWLATHPERDQITRRYLRHHRTLGDRCRQSAGRARRPGSGRGTTRSRPPRRPPRWPHCGGPPSLPRCVTENASSVVDFGCGEGALLRDLLDDPAFGRVLGVDVSARTLDVATRRLNLDRLSDTQRARLELIQSSVTYRDDRLSGYDAIVLMEVIEHVDADRLTALQRNVFGAARPSSVIITTPNVEHNVRYPFLPAGSKRHRDHRFEWSRAEFTDWARSAAASFGYDVRLLPVGFDDPEVGAPTQLAVFRRSS